MLQVTLVKWNEPYQKLASCDSTGIIFVWIKVECALRMCIVQQYSFFSALIACSQTVSETAPNLEKRGLANRGKEK